MKNNTLVYAHYTNDTNEIFYVGEGSLKRSHAAYGRNIYWQRKVKKHNGFKVKILASNLSKKEATRLESKIIIALKKRGYKLTNLLDSTISEYIRHKGNPKTSERNRINRGLLSPVWGLKRPDLVLRNKTGNFKRATKPIQCIETGQIFNSIQDANRHFNKPKSTQIVKCLKGRIKTAFNLNWKYLTV